MADMFDLNSLDGVSFNGGDVGPHYPGIFEYKVMYLPLQ